MWKPVPVGVGVEIFLQRGSEIGVDDRDGDAGAVVPGRDRLRDAVSTLKLPRSIATDGVWLEIALRLGLVGGQLRAPDVRTRSGIDERWRRGSAPDVRMYACLRETEDPIDQTSKR